MIRRLILPLIALACVAERASAGLVIESPSILNTSPGASGSFDINVRYVADSPGPGPAYSVAGFTVNLSIDATDVVFTGVSDSTSNPYLLNFSGSDHIGLTVIDPDPIPPGGTTYLTFFDAALPPDFPGRIMNEGDVFGLARIYYSVAADASYGTRAILIDQPSPGGITDLTSSAGESILSGVNGGTLRVNSVPEPSSIVLSSIFGIASAIHLLLRRRSAGRRSNQPQNSI